MRKRVIIAIIIFLTLPLTSCNKYKDLLSINIIDVGQGDCILISTPENKNILIDGGDENSERIIKSYLKKRKIKKLDIVIATHFDKDHIGSLDYIIDKFNIGKVYTSKDIDKSQAYNNLIKSCRNKNLNFEILKKGDKIKITKDINIIVLNPSYIQENKNLNSIAINTKSLLKNVKTFLLT